VAVKPDRIRIYLLEDVGEDGNVDMQYVLQPSDASDQGYWAGLAYISGHEKLTGAQAEHVVIYDVVMDDHVPLYNTSDARLTVLGSGEEEIQRLKVMSVGLLRQTGEKLARCLDISDAADTLTV
jgi:hypothetical protein